MDRHTAWLRRPTVRITIARDRDHPEQLVGKVVKTWWGGPGVGGLSRILGEHWIDVGDAGETEAVSAMLVDLGLAMRGGLYEL